MRAANGLTESSTLVAFIYDQYLIVARWIVDQGRTGYQKAQVAKSTERRQYGKITESKRRQCSKMKEKAKGAGVIAHLVMYGQSGPGFW